MDLDIMFANILHGIDSVLGKTDFHAELQKCALRCAKGLAPIHDEWNDMLSSILHNWEADVKMSPYEAVDYMMTVCGYGYLGEETIELNKSDFWFLQSEQCKTLGLDESKSKRLYYITIAIFETINYWCWHDAPVQITFDSEGLQGVLRYGRINIDWNSYKKSMGSDSSLSESSSLPM